MYNKKTLRLIIFFVVIGLVVKFFVGTAVMAVQYSDPWGCEMDTQKEGTYCMEYESKHWCGDNANACTLWSATPTKDPDPSNGTYDFSCSSCTWNLNCISGYTACGTSCVANDPLPANCTSYNQCTDTCTQCEDGFSLEGGICEGVSLKLANDSVASDGNVKQSTSPIFYINPTSNVGISTSTPQSKLHVIGGVKMSNLDGSYKVPTADTELVPLKYVNENFAPITGGSGSTFLQGGNSFGATATLGTNDAYNLDFITSSTTRMTIDTSGNVGIGTTVPGAKLNIGSGGNLLINGTGSGIISVGHGIRTSSRAEIHLHASGANTPSEIMFGYDSRSDSNVRWTISDRGQTSGLLDFYEGPSLAGSYISRMTLKSGGNVGIATNAPAYKLDVDGTGRFTNTLIVGTPTADTHATTKSYVDSVLNNPEITGDLNMGGNNILAVNKLTVNTIDPLYDINNILYSSYAASVVGGVKEEYIGKTKINSYNSSKGEYEKVIDFKKQKEGTELWLWYKTVDFNEDNVDVFMIPYGSLADVYYEIINDSIVLRSDKKVAVSYRLIGKRFDWKSWPTIAEDQSQEAGLIIK